MQRIWLTRTISLSYNFIFYFLDVLVLMCVKWPSQSPYLCLIENLWRYLRLVSHRCFPGTKRLRLTQSCCKICTRRHFVLAHVRKIKKMFQSKFQKHKREVISLMRASEQSLISALVCSLQGVLQIRHSTPQTLASRRWNVPSSLLHHHLSGCLEIPPPLSLLPFPQCPALTPPWCHTDRPGALSATSFGQQ